MDTEQRITSLEFTGSQDWFTPNIPHWKKLFPRVKSSAPRVLEIGSWEGRSAVFLCENLCRTEGQLVCVDHFDLFQSEAGRKRFERINKNLAATGTRFRILPEFSVPALFKLLVEEMSSPHPGFDWVYIDGSHRADDTLLDAELAWRLAKRDALLVFDDYHWNEQPEGSVYHPRRGIDSFLSLHRGEYERLSDESHYQVFIKKEIDTRIGFLVPEVSSGINVAADINFDYGLNIAFTIDSLYAMPAAVALCSLVENTTGKITVYVIDCGLSANEKNLLSLSLPRSRNDVTLVFTCLPRQSAVREEGATWAKVEIHKILSVQRVLYLDADILVRSSLKTLWETDLGGNSIAAAFDVGFPRGHDEIRAGPYFNAGVLLMDLAQIRSRSKRLEDMAERMKNAKYKDQDVLNLCFADDWKPLSLRWNAQGLGTYADFPSPERNGLDKEEMVEPSIVHFTGRVHPRMGDILNPYVQPPPAKPWGYAGAPGHPYETEWLEVLERTSWKDPSLKAAWKEDSAQAKVKAIEEGLQTFHVKLRRESLEIM